MDRSPKWKKEVRAPHQVCGVGSTIPHWGIDQTTTQNIRSAVTGLLPSCQVERYCTSCFVGIKYDGCAHRWWSNDEKETKSTRDGINHKAPSRVNIQIECNMIKRSQSHESDEGDSKNDKECMRVKAN